jgi:hypothetical protein
MGEFSSKDYNISKRLDSCQPSNLKILKDTLLVILSPFASLRVNSAKNLKAVQDLKRKKRDIENGRKEWSHTG